jgi:hypothetical protein
MIPPASIVQNDHLHRHMIVRIKLKDHFLFDIDSRVAEVIALRDWLDELVEWDRSKYELKVHAQGTRAIIVFDEIEHAILCKLRWS